MVFQKYTLFPWLTVCQNVMFGLESIGKDRDTAENIALQWLDIIGLAGMRTTIPDSFPEACSSVWRSPGPSRLSRAFY